MNKTLKASIYIFLVCGVILFIVSLILPNLTFDEMTFWLSIVLVIIGYVASDEKRETSFGRLKRVYKEQKSLKKDGNDLKMKEVEEVEEIGEEGREVKEEGREVKSLIGQSEFTLKNIRLACYIVAFIYVAIDFATFYIF